MKYIKLRDGMFTAPGWQRDRLRCTIIGASRTQAYWVNGVLECSSDDGVVGRGTPGGECHECPLRRSRACREAYRYTIRTGDGVYYLQVSNERAYRALNLNVLDIIDGGAEVEFAVRRINDGKYTIDVNVPAPAVPG